MCSENQAFARQLASWSSVAVKHSGMDLNAASRVLRAKLEELREFAVSRVSKIRELLARPENIQEAHEALAERVGRLTLEATNENGKKTNLAHGKVDFFGEEELAHSDGAGGPAWTERL